MAVTFTKLRPICGLSCKAFHTSTARSIDDTSHYETLKVPSNCSAKEIRNAFIQLSKKYHPDTTNQTSSHAHAQFIKINEAYSILSKPDKRQEYDFNLENKTNTDRNWEVYSNGSTKEKSWRDETIWHMRNENEDGKYADKPYYGIKGVQKISNAWIVIACVIFTAIGVSLQAIAIRKSFTMSREILDQRSKDISIVHQALRHQAEVNGNERQIQLIKKKLETNSTN